MSFILMKKINLLWFEFLVLTGHLTKNIITLEDPPFMCLILVCKMLVLKFQVVSSFSVGCFFKTVTLSSGECSISIKSENIACFTTISCGFR